MKPSGVQRTKDLDLLFGTLPPFLRRHSERVAVYARMLAEEAFAQGAYPGDPAFTSGFVARAGDCAYWHDIGKAFISNDIWNLERPLTMREYALVKTHPVLGAAALEEKLDLPSQKRGADSPTSMARDSILLHHERWDGSGYPFGYAGGEIPLIARITTVADVFDSMTDQRPYNKVKSHIQAREELLKRAGTQFDPVLARIFAYIAGGQGLASGVGNALGGMRALG